MKNRQANKLTADRKILGKPKKTQTVLQSKNIQNNANSLKIKR